MPNLFMRVFILLGILWQLSLSLSLSRRHHKSQATEITEDPSISQFCSNPHWETNSTAAINVSFMLMAHSLATSLPELYVSLDVEN